MLVPFVAAQPVLRAEGGRERSSGNAASASSECVRSRVSEAGWASRATRWSASGERSAASSSRRSSPNFMGNERQHETVAVVEIGLPAGCASAQRCAAVDGSGTTAVRPMQRCRARQPARGQRRRQRQRSAPATKAIGGTGRWRRRRLAVIGEAQAAQAPDGEKLNSR